MAAARATPFTLPETEDRKTQVWLIGFGDSALNFELVVWPTFDAVKRPAAMHAAYTWAIEDALRSAQIEVPYPQMDVRVRSLFGQEGGEAFTALGLKAASLQEPAPHPVVETKNDAADALVAEVEREARERLTQDRE